MGAVLCARAEKIIYVKFTSPLNRSFMQILIMTKSCGVLREKKNRLCLRCAIVDYRLWLDHINGMFAIAILTFIFFY